MQFPTDLLIPGYRTCLVIDVPTLGVGKEGGHFVVHGLVRSVGNALCSRFLDDYRHYADGLLAVNAGGSTHIRSV